MRTLTIEAASLRSARDSHAALSRFRPHLEESPTGVYTVSVSFHEDRDILRVLRALETYVAERDEHLRRN